MMSSSPTRGLSTLTGRRSREESNNQPHYVMQNQVFLNKILPFAAKKVESPTVFKSVSSSWHENVVYQGGGVLSWIACFRRLRQENPKKASIQLMNLLDASFTHIVKSPPGPKVDPTLYWILDCIFFACDELHFRIDVLYGRGRLINAFLAARNSLIQNKELAKKENEGDLKHCFFNFCLRFQGEALSHMLWDTLRECCYSPDPQNIKIVKIIIDDHCHASIERVLIGCFQQFAFGHPCLCNELPVLLQGLQKLNKLDAARNILLEYAHPFLHHVASVLTSAIEVSQVLSNVKKYFGDSLLRQLFLQISSIHYPRPLLSYALCYRKTDCFGALVETASNLGDDFFVDLCLMVDNIESLPPLAFACFLKLDKEAALIVSKIRNIKDSSLVRRFVEAHQNLACVDPRTRMRMMELLKKEGLIEEDE